ncbi:MAG: tyrosine-type recombinase/integrase [Thiobacillaceae bacterium]
MNTIQNGVSTFSALLESFFLDRLLRQRQVSSHTIASYRDTFRLLLQFAQQRLRKSPSALSLPDLDAAFVGVFLDHLEQDRDNSVRSRNARLAAIHSFFRYVALHAPEYSAVAQCVLAMPSKRYVRRPIAYLTPDEADALLAAPDLTTWIGRRDRALLLLALRTGLRASELLGLRGQDFVLGAGAHVRCMGKGRKERCTPLRKNTVAVLRSWLRECQYPPSDPIFKSLRGTALSHDSLEYLLNKHLAVARLHCPSLIGKNVTPHSLRHSLAMNLLHHGADRVVIALWLGHESVETTAIYFQADMQLKEQALAKAATTNVRAPRFRPNDRLLAFLKSL